MALRPQAEWERYIFTEFADAAGLGVDAGSVRSAEPPAPDIICSIGGQPHCFEMVSVTSQVTARNHAIALKTMKPTGNAFDPFNPLAEALRSKQKRGKRYVTGGLPLMLLAYYDQEPCVVEVEPDLFTRIALPIAREMVASVWQKIWVYERSGRVVHWTYPEIDGGREMPLDLIALNDVRLRLQCAKCGTAVTLKPQDWPITNCANSRCMAPWDPRAMGLHPAMNKLAEAFEGLEQTADALPFRIAFEVTRPS